MGRRAGITDPYEYYVKLLKKGVPRYAASRALRAHIRRTSSASRVVFRYKGAFHRHRSPDFCGKCYERSKGK